MATNDDTTQTHAAGDAAAAGTGTSNAEPGVDSPNAQASEGTENARAKASEATENARAKASEATESARAKASDATDSARQTAGAAASQVDDAFNEKPELFAAGAFAAGLGVALLLRALGGGSDDD